MWGQVPSLGFMQTIMNDASRACSPDDVQDGDDASTPGKHRVAVHFSPPALVASPVYQAWLRRLGPSWTHMMCTSGRDQKMTLRRATELQVGQAGQKDHRPALERCPEPFTLHLSAALNPSPCT